MNRLAKPECIHDFIRQTDGSFRCPHCNSFLHDTPPRLVVLVAPDVRFPVAIKDGGRWDGTENAA